MIGIFVGLILVVKFATSPQLQEAIIDQAIANDPDVAHLYNRHHVAIWSWVLSGVFAFGLGNPSRYSAASLDAYTKVLNICFSSLHLLLDCCLQLLLQVKECQACARSGDGRNAIDCILRISERQPIISMK